MSIKDDMETIKTKEQKYFDNNGHYLQIYATPTEIPEKDSDTGMTELNSVDGAVAFVPTCKDYQFEVHVCSRQVDGVDVGYGASIFARRALKDNVYETIEWRKEVDG